jgi:hypothetical protein
MTLAMSFSYQQVLQRMQAQYANRLHYLGIQTQSDACQSHRNILLLLLQLRYPDLCSILS